MDKADFYRLTKPYVALIGMHPRHISEAPFDDPEWEIWTMNEAWGPKWKDKLKRFDRHIQIHADDVWRRPANWNDDRHEEWIKAQHDKPIYMQEVYPDVPAAVKFPRDEIVARYELDRFTDFFSATIPHGIALALFMGPPKKLGLWGVEANSESEYGSERDSISFWLGIAKGMGCKLVFPESCQLLGAGRRVYGYDGLNGITPVQLNKRLDLHKKKSEQVTVALQDAVQERDQIAIELRGLPAGLRQKRLGDIADSYQMTMNALALAALWQGVVKEDEELLAIVSGSKLEFLTSVIIEQRQNQFAAQGEGFRSRFSDRLGRRTAVTKARAQAQAKNEKNRLQKQLNKLDQEISDFLAKVNFAFGMVAEDQALRRIANGIADDLAVDVSGHIVTMRPYKEDKEGNEIK